MYAILNFHGTPPNFKIDTQNNGLEKLISFQIWLFWVSWICSRCLEKVKHILPNGGFNSDLPTSDLQCYTPLKITLKTSPRINMEPKKNNMKPKNHPIEKENHLDQTSMTLGSIR